MNVNTMKVRMIRIMTSLLVSNFGNFTRVIFVAPSLHTGNPFFLSVCANKFFLNTISETSLQNIQQFKSLYNLRSFIYFHENDLHIR